MSQITEILGENKFFNSSNTDLKTRLILEESNKIRYENNLFFDISQQTQYLIEKFESNKFRFYGKLNTVVNKDINQLNNLTNIDYSLLNFNKENWSLVLLKPKRFESNVNQSGEQKYLKGLKKLSRLVNGIDIINIDLNKGLPAKEFLNESSNNVSLFLPLGSNFKVGDKIKIDSTNLNILSNGLYRVIGVNGDVITINTTYNQIPTQLIKPTLEQPQNNDFYLANTRDQAQFIKGVRFDNKPTPNFLNNRRDNPNIMIEKPLCYVSKVINREVLEYYVKCLEVIAVIDEVDNCSFSLNTYKEKINNFFIKNELDLTDVRNNLNEPITDLFIGVIKTPSQNNNISRVETHFDKFIDNLNIGFGLNVINKTPTVGDIFYESLCEYTTEGLNEITINHISHKFTHRDVGFYYTPFTKIPIKLKSTYIENGDNIMNTPNYAVYSREKETYIWRDVFDVGINDEDGNVINLPFINDAFYVYCDIIHILKAEKFFTKKYLLNSNDLNTTNATFFEQVFGNLLDNVNYNDANPNDPKGVKPFIEFINDIC